MKKNIVLNLSFSVLLMIFTLTIFPMLSGNKLPDTLKPLDSYVTKINSINDHTLKSLNKDLLKEENKISLEKAVDSLTTVKSNIDTLSIASEHKDLKDNLSSGLNANILFYRQLLGILNNPKGKDLKDSKNNLKNYETSACSLYKNTSPLKIYFFNGDNEVLANLYLALTNLESSNRDSALSVENNKVFMVSFENIIDRLMSLNTNFDPYIEKCRNKTYSYDALMKDIDNNLNSLDSINIDVYSLSVPKDASFTYDNFKDVISSYKIYLSSFQQDLYKDMSSVGKESFENSTSKKEELDLILQRFKDSLKNYKNKFNL